MSRPHFLTIQRSRNGRTESGSRIEVIIKNKYYRTVSAVVCIEKTDSASVRLVGRSEIHSPFEGRWRSKLLNPGSYNVRLSNFEANGSWRHYSREVIVSNNDVTIYLGPIGTPVVNQAVRFSPTLAPHRSKSTNSRSRTLSGESGTRIYAPSPVPDDEDETCGFVAPSGIRCGNCGVVSGSNAKYCSNCGRKLNI